MNTSALAYDITDFTLFDRLRYYAKAKEGLYFLPILEAFKESESHKYDDLIGYIKEHYSLKIPKCQISLTVAILDKCGVLEREGYGRARKFTITDEQKKLDALIEEINLKEV